MSLAVPDLIEQKQRIDELQTQLDKLKQTTLRQIEILEAHLHDAANRINELLVMGGDGGEEEG